VEEAEHAQPVALQVDANLRSCCRAVVTLRPWQGVLLFRRGQRRLGVVSAMLGRRIFGAA